jgi:hypothetical protein
LQNPFHFFFGLYVRITLQEFGTVDDAFAGQVGRQDGAGNFSFTNNAECGAVVGVL